MHSREIILLTAAILVCSLFVLGISEQSAKEKYFDKINGLSYVAPRNSITETDLVTVKKTHANWVAIMPYAFSSGNAELHYNHQRQWWGETLEGAGSCIELAHTLKLKVMLKPHIWVKGQGWAGDFSLTNEIDWENWEKNYTEYIMQYAKLADSLNVEMLCIGTEFRQVIKQRPHFWRLLIQNIKNIYSGKLTYAANWDNYRQVTFWSDLDFIGIDAYFPLSDERTPSSVNLSQQWKKKCLQLQDFSKDKKKPILFTEIGYQSIDYTTAGHWKYEQDTLQVNLQGQLEAYHALFKNVWNKDWYAGGFIWKWHPKTERYGGPNCKRFTPQGKPAEHLITKWYKKASPATISNRTAE